MPQTIGKLLSTHSLDIRAVTNVLRKVVKNCLPNIYESISDKSIRYSLDQSLTSRICSITPHKTYVALGFIAGDTLPDHQHLFMSGKGRMRYVKIQRVDQTGNPALKALIVAARNR